MRQVFFDPFGSYANAYDRGISAQSALEKSTRDARREDFSYNYQLPLEYRAQQRADSLGTYALPIQKHTLDRNNYVGDQEVNKGFAQGFGITSPYENTAYRYFGVTPHLDQYTQPVDPRIAQGRQKYLENIDNTLSVGVPDSPELRRRAAEDVARYYNIPVEAMLNPNPQPPQPQPLYNFTQQGPDGSPVQVGSMMNPHETLLRYLNQEPIQQQAKVINELRQEGFDNSIRSRQSDIYGRSIDAYGGGRQQSYRPSASENYGLYGQ